MDSQYPVPVASHVVAPVHGQAVPDTLGQQLSSERVVVSAPLSFHGSAVRIWKLTKLGPNGLAQAGLIALALVLIATAWTGVLAWYMVWGLWLVPYRLIRRGGRKRKVQALQHREMLAALQQRNS
jgi:hypothetical protein